MTKTVQVITAINPTARTVTLGAVSVSHTPRPPPEISQWKVKWFDPEVAKLVFDLSYDFIEAVWSPRLLEVKK